MFDVRDLFCWFFIAAVSRRLEIDRPPTRSGSGSAKSDSPPQGKSQEYA